MDTEPLHAMMVPRSFAQLKPSAVWADTYADLTLVLYVSPCAGRNLFTDHNSSLLSMGMLFLHTGKLHPQHQQPSLTPLSDTAADQIHLDGTPFKEKIFGAHSGVYNHDGRKPGVRRILPRRGNGGGNGGNRRGMRG